MIDSYRIVIGCEIHCQLTTKTKAFCACENRYGGMPDTRVCPVCRKAIAPDQALTARLFNKAVGKKHVHIIGCSNCHKPRAD